MYESENVKHQAQMIPAAHIKDRISNMGAMVLVFLAGKNISFSTLGKPLILKIVGSTRVLYSGPNIRAVGY